MKIFAFREQFILTNHGVQALKCICLFTTTIYIKAWVDVGSSRHAPINDLSLLRNLENFNEVDSVIAQTAAINLISLALFSDLVSADEKTTIVAAFWRPTKKNDLQRVEAKKIASFREVQLANFATELSLNIFTALNLEHSFLSSKPDTWSSRQDYLNTV